MAQIVIPPITLPSVPKDWMSTLLGIILGVGLLLQEYMKTHATISYETLALAVAIAVICYFIPAKLTPTEQAALTLTVAKTINSAAGEKIPAIMTEERTITAMEKQVVDTMAAAKASEEPAPATIQIGS